MQRVAAAAKQSLNEDQTVTHMGHGAGRVAKVATNRRNLDGDGRVVLQRQSSGGCNTAARAAPMGTNDPLVRMISFWNADEPVAVLTYYATQPQSYYGRGGFNWDFVGMARAMREDPLPGLPHLHFNGAGGNITAGKYNDGVKEKRPLLARRLATGMKLAWESQRKLPIHASEIDRTIVRVSLLVQDILVDDKLLAKILDKDQPTKERLRVASDLTFVRRMSTGHRIPLSCL